MLCLVPVVCFPALKMKPFMAQRWKADHVLSARPFVMSPRGGCELPQPCTLPAQGPPRLQSSQGHQAALGTRLCYSAGLRPQPAPAHPWGCRSEVNQCDGSGRLDATWQIEVSCRVNLKWAQGKLAKMSRVNRASQIRCRAEPSEEIT